MTSVFFYFFQTKYDLVVCAFTFLEFKDQGERLTYLDTLWRRVEPGGYLILVEVGSIAGFFTMSEARSYLIESFKNPELSGHIYAPVSLKILMFIFNLYKHFKSEWAPNTLLFDIYILMY